MNNTMLAVQWLFLDLNAFFASCEQQEDSALHGKPVIVVQTVTDSAVAIAASYEAKAHGIKTGTVVKKARRLCPDVIPVQANHRQDSRRDRTGPRALGAALGQCQRPARPAEDLDNWHERNGSQFDNANAL